MPESIHHARNDWVFSCVESIVFVCIWVYLGVIYCGLHHYQFCLYKRALISQFQKAQVLINESMSSLCELFIKFYGICLNFCLLAFDKIIAFLSEALPIFGQKKKLCHANDESKFKIFCEKYESSKNKLCFLCVFCFFLSGIFNVADKALVFFSFHLFSFSLWAVGEMWVLIMLRSWLHCWFCSNNSNSNKSRFELINTSRIHEFPPHEQLWNFRQNRDVFQ